jgi:predicted NAD/FAD-binding protein
MSERFRIAVVGGGAAGLSAAYVLGRRHEVTLFEKEPALGGHVRTVTIASGEDAGATLEMGFTILNDRNYQVLHRLLARLGIDGISPSDMSFGYESIPAGIRYAINFRGDDRATNLDDSPLGPLLAPALRFCRVAPRDLRSGFLAGKSFGEYCRERNFSPDLIEHYLAPLGAASWSLGPESILDFPAETYVGFFDHHGLYGFDEGPEWQYIEGGAARYVRAIAGGFTGHLELGVRDLRVARDAEGVTVRVAGRAPARFDYLVLATHADQALALVVDPSTDERRLLGAWSYRPNHCVLHTDASAMPADKSAWASWSFKRERAGEPCAITYHLNRIQRRSAFKRQYFLSHNRNQIPREHVIAEASFRHPAFTLESLATQRQIRALNGTRRTYYAGSYLGYGFHEDAVQSGAAVAEAFGLSL